MTLKGRKIYLKPSEVYFGGDESVVHTVLGSCVSVVMYCHRRKTGAICHAVMPESGAGADGFDWKYVDKAVSHLSEKFREMGIYPEDTEVKVFGGAETMAGDSPAKYTVGRRNVEKALRMLKDLGYRVHKFDVGGNLGRSLYFDTASGKVYLKKIKKSRPLISA